MCGHLVLKQGHANTTLLAPGTPTGACLLPGVSLVRDLQVCSQRQISPKLWLIIMEGPSTACHQAFWACAGMPNSGHSYLCLQQLLQDILLRPMQPVAVSC